MAFSERLRTLMLGALGLPELVDELEEEITNILEEEIADGAVTTAKLDDDAVTTAKINANAVGDTELRQGAALTVIGRSANSTGNVADIAAGSDGQVLRRSGTTLGFGTVGTAGIADDAVTAAKLDSGLIQLETVTIPHASILTLGTAPVTLVTAPGAGFTIDFISAYAYYDFETAAYTLAAETVDIEYGSGATVLALLTNGEITGAADVRKSMRAAVANLTPVDNSALQLTTSGNTDPAAGNAAASLKVRVYYRIIPYSL